MKKILVIFGTRPEAIKLAPLIQRLKQEKEHFNVQTCITAQHRQMLDQVLDFFKINPDIDLNLMEPNQTLASFTSQAIIRISSILSEIKPSLVLVQGDTTTAFVGALAAFYQKISVVHVEAGLRTQDIYSPFPEEVNRKLISIIAKFHFAPTKKAAQYLISEGIQNSSVLVTGNTIVDAFQDGLKIIQEQKDLKKDLENWFCQKISTAKQILSGKCKCILITGHRRESFGKGMESICQAIRDLSFQYPHHSFIYPVHLNPHVQQPVMTILEGLPNVFLIEPIEYSKMLYLIQKTYLILTDSGGIQEEAPSLKIPVLIMRNKTERPEGIELGCSLLVGNEREQIRKKTSALLDNQSLYESMQKEFNPYGDGKASERIVTFLKGAIFE